VSRDRGEALSLALEIEDTTPWEPKAAETPAFERRRQIVVVDQAPQVDGAPLVLAFPSPFGEGSGRGFVATLSVQRQKSRPSEADLARCRAEITGTAAAAKRGAAPVDGVAAAALTLRTTLANLDLAHHHRASLVFLAGTVEAPLALDLSLIADDPTLAAWIATTGAAGTKDAGQAELGWKLEKSAFAILAKGLDGDGLPPQLMALMAHHAGEAGLLPGAMSTLLPRCNDRAALQRAIVQENLDALDSTDPSSRVRAFDWLKLRGQAPKGYDPLAPKADRRKALAPREEVQGR
ncbi:MAG: hypothetical protein KDC87_05815, partial [Planctomycetes bacterium]|nr:hypothetical protein [Planctomycetota bacterium]